MVHEELVRRRDFIIVGGLAACCWPVAIEAQTAPRTLRVGVVSAINPRTASFWIAFEQRMRELGHIEGQTYILDFVNLGGQIDRYPDETKALVARNADIIIASGIELALTSAVAATSSLPIVMIAADYDPIALGHVTNLARPESNVTGLLFQQVELVVKRIEIFKFAFPNLSAAAVLWDRISAEQWQAVQRAGP